MKIQEVVKRTGIQKRTIYYYIDEKLIAPTTNQTNGYHDFSEEDIQKLLIIRKLRDAQLPICDIRAILQNPRTTAFYLHKQLNHLQTDLLVLQETLNNLDQFAAQFNVCQTLEQLSAQLSVTNFKPDTQKYSVHYESRDSRLIAQYLWQAYIDEPMTEYRQFLWQKLMQFTLEHTQTDLKTMSQYLQYLPPEQVDAASVNQYLRSQKIIALTEEEIPSFVEKLKTSLRLFASDAVQKEQWKLLYHPVIRPATIFGFSSSRWMLEFHPDYRRYYENIHTCCMMLKDYMDSKEGQELQILLQDAFDGYCDFESSSYGELEIAASFQGSVYALLQPEEIRQFLLCGDRFRDS